VRLRSLYKNHVWSWDFVMDRTADGRAIRILTLIDEFTKEALEIYAAHRIRAHDVIDLFADVMIERGIPEHTRSDNGPVMVAKKLREWLDKPGTKTLCIATGSPWENGYCESFNGKLRNELLNGGIYYTLREAQVLIEQLRHHYNRVRPHSALGYRPPAPEAWGLAPRPRLFVTTPQKGCLNSLQHWTNQSGLDISTRVYSKVSRSFLRYYYKVVLDDPYSVVMCAATPDGTIKGFATGTLDAEKHFSQLSRHRVIFALMLLRSMVTSPAVLRQAVARYRSSKGKGAKKCVVTRGARTENWVWFPRDGSSILAVVLNNSHLRALRILGEDVVHFEVDVDNAAVVRFSVGNGAKLVDCIELDDGPRRNIYKYDLAEKFAARRVTR
jgi:hypothetical protein